MARVVQETGGLYGEQQAPWTFEGPDEPFIPRPLSQRDRKRLPVSVSMCLSDSHKIVLWRRDGSGEPWEIPFRCQSWRCPRCRPKVGLVDYARVAQALQSRGPWIYAVLTLPGEWRGWDVWSRYKAAGELWNLRLRKRLQRRYGRVLYVQTWEQHRDGTPHVNLVLGGESLIEDVEAKGDGGASYHPRLGRHVRVPRWRRWFADTAAESGFGTRTWVERLWEPSDGAERPSDGLAAYMVKLSHNLVGVDGGRSSLDRAAGEVTRGDAKDQTPLQAPRGFRRLRTSQRLLPPRLRSPELSGTLRDAREADWHWGNVSSHLAGRLEAIEAARRTLLELQSQGLPIPPRIARMAARGTPAEDQARAYSPVQARMREAPHESGTVGA